MTYWDGAMASGYVLRLHVDYAGQNTDANYSTWSCYLEILKGSGSGKYNLSGNKLSWSVSINGYAPSGSTNYDFRSASQQTLWSGTLNFGHDGAGNLSFGSSSSAAANTGDSSALGSGSAGGNTTAPRIAHPPQTATSPISIDTITPTGVNYNFSWGGDDGGSGITGYAIQIATDSGFTNVVQTATVSGSPGVITGLTPATAYYFRSAAQNARGTGPWSSTLTATTLGGVKYYDPATSTFKECQAFVCINGAFVAVTPKICRDGSTFVSLTS